MTAPVTVTTADYEAVQAFFRDERTGLAVKFQLGAEPRVILEAFARHRQQAASASNAQVAELREALDSIDVWLSDTLSGRVQPDPATYKQWLIDAIVEARGRARKALARAKSSSDGEGV